MSRLNAALVLLVVALGIFFYIDNRMAPAKLEKEKNEKRLFPGVKIEELVGTSVEKLKEKGAPKMSLKKDGLLWYSDDGSQRMTLGNTMVGGSLRSLVELTRNESLDQDTNPAEFGLDKPVFRITMTFKNGKTQELIVGDMTPDDTAFYVRAGDGKVATIPKAISDLLDAKIDRFRETGVMPYDPSKVNRLVMTGPKGTVEVGLEKPRELKSDEMLDEGIQITDLSEKWRISRPEAAPADANKVRDVLFALKNARAERFLNPTEKVDFSKPSVHIEVGIDGVEKPFKIDIGSTVPVKPTLYYVRRYDPDETMVVTLSDQKILDPKVETFLQRHLTNNFEPGEVGKLSAIIDGQELAASRSGNDWRFSKPDRATSNVTIQNGVANDFLNDVKNLEWTSRAAAAPPQWKDRAQVQVFGKDGKSLGNFTVGPAVESGGVYAKKDGDSQVYQLATDPISKWQSQSGRLLATPKPTFTPKPGALIPTPVPVAH